MNLPLAGVKQCESLHVELELLAEADLSNEEPLMSATRLPAKWFRMEDRGAINVEKCGPRA